MMKKNSVANRILACVVILAVTMSSFMFWNLQTHAGNKIPNYSGDASVELNNNVPTFTTDEITTRSYEKYGNLDKLGRCTIAVSCIGRDLMPTEERQSIGDVRPTGWKQNKYPGIVDSDPPYLYNRCHMIGFQLTGENDNEKNLITGTRYMNVEGMLPYENQVAEYIKDTGNHVMYRVTPIFTGKNLLCDGVQIEAYSVEDKGEGVSFNVFCYNVQPGVTIDYKTGSNKADPNYKKAVSLDEFVITGGNSDKNIDRSVPAQKDSEVTYILNKNSKKFHLTTCDSVKDMKEKNKVYSTKSREEIIEDGYIPCNRCSP